MPSDSPQLSTSGTALLSVGVRSSAFAAAAPLGETADGGTFVPGSGAPTVTLGGSRDLPDHVLAQRFPGSAGRTAGTHAFHFGGRYDRWLQIPVITR